MTAENWGGTRQGAGRKPRDAGQPRKAVSVTLSQAAYARLREHADAHGCSLSVACEALILQSGEWQLGRVVPQAGETEVEA